MRIHPLLRLRCAEQPGLNADSADNMNANDRRNPSIATCRAMERVHEREAVVAHLTCCHSLGPQTHELKRPRTFFVPHPWLTRAACTPYAGVSKTRRPRVKSTRVTVTQRPRVKSMRVTVCMLSAPCEGWLAADCQGQSARMANFARSFKISLFPTAGLPDGSCAMSDLTTNIIAFQNAIRVTMSSKPASWSASQPASQLASRSASHTTWLEEMFCYRCSCNPHSFSCSLLESAPKPTSGKYPVLRTWREPQ